MKKILTHRVSSFILFLATITFFAGTTAKTVNAAYGPDSFVIAQNVASFYIISNPTWTMKYIKNLTQGGPTSDLLQNLNSTPRALSIESNVTSTEFTHPSNQHSYAGFGSIKNIDRCKNITTLFAVTGKTNPTAGALIENHNGTGATNIQLYEDNVPTANLGIGQSYATSPSIKKVIGIASETPGQPNPYEVCSFVAWDFTPDWLGITTVWASPTFDMSPVGTWNQGQAEQLKVKVFSDKTTTVNLSSELCFPAPSFNPSSYTVSANSWPNETNINVTIPLGTTGNCRIKANGTYNGTSYPQQSTIINVN